jgi:hypothetical protein
VDPVEDQRTRFGRVRRTLDYLPAVVPPGVEGEFLVRGARSAQERPRLGYGEVAVMAAANDQQRSLEPSDRAQTVEPPARQARLAREADDAVDV